MSPPIRLSPGDLAPEFTLPDADGEPVSLAGFRGRSVVVYCYPAAGTPGCTKQACDFRDNLAELDTAGFAVVASRRTSRRSWLAAVPPRASRSRCCPMWTAAC